MQKKKTVRGKQLFTHSYILKRKAFKVGAENKVYFQYLIADRDTVTLVFSVGSLVLKRKLQSFQWKTTLRADIRNNIFRNHILYSDSHNYIWLNQRRLFVMWESTAYLSQLFETYDRLVWRTLPPRDQTGPRLSAGGSTRHRARSTLRNVRYAFLCGDGAMNVTST